MSCNIEKRRKRVVVTLQKKLEALKRIDHGESLVSIARQLGVSATTVGDWKKCRKQLESYATKTSAQNSNRRSMKQPVYVKTNEATYVWFQQHRSQGIPLSGPIIQAKAKALSQHFPGEKDFVASDGWLSKWKKRYGIRKLHIEGEKLSADYEAAILFCDQLQDVLEKGGYSLDQLYNCDETGLNFKMMPSTTLAARDDSSVIGMKKNKERLTVMICANAAGTHRLPLMVIGKSCKPRPLKDIRQDRLPVFYKHQKSAWMSASLFELWFNEQFAPKVRDFLASKGLPQKALLLMDNAPSHPTADVLKSGGITAMFFPANVTSLIQPMDQGVIETFKRGYRKLLLQTLVLCDENSSLEERLRTINIKHAIYWSAESWANVRQSTLKASWNNLLNPEEEEEASTDANETPQVSIIFFLPYA